MKVFALFAALAISGVMSQSEVSYSASIVPGQGPVYDYAYNINDISTGNHQNHQQIGRGDAVSGSYSLLQPDGVTRIVDYTANEHSGFNAHVHYEPPHGAVPVVSKVAIPQAVPSPAVLPTIRYVTVDKSDIVQQLPQVAYSPYAYAAVPYAYSRGDSHCALYGPLVLCPAPVYDNGLSPPKLKSTVVYH